VKMNDYLWKSFCTVLFTGFVGLVLLAYLT
jgi:hypothetical protein